LLNICIKNCFFYNVINAGSRFSFLNLDCVFVSINSCLQIFNDIKNTINESNLEQKQKDKINKNLESFSKDFSQTKEIFKADQ
jgi:hypothetical protein